MTSKSFFTKNKKKIFVDNINMIFYEGHLYKQMWWQSRDSYLRRIAIIIGDGKFIYRDGTLNNS